MNQLVLGGQLYWAFPFSKGSLAITNIATDTVTGFFEKFGFIKVCHLPVCKQSKMG